MSIDFDIKNLNLICLFEMRLFKSFKPKYAASRQSLTDEFKKLNKSLLYKFYNLLVNYSS